MRRTCMFYIHTYRLLLVKGHYRSMTPPLNGCSELDLSGVCQRPEGKRTIFRGATSQIFSLLMIVIGALPYYFVGCWWHLTLTSRERIYVTRYERAYS